MFDSLDPAIPKAPFQEEAIIQEILSEEELTRLTVNELGKLICQSEREPSDPLKVEGRLEEMTARQLAEIEEGWGKLRGANPGEKQQFLNTAISKLGKLNALTEAMDRLLDSYLLPGVSQRNYNLTHFLPTK